MTNYEKEYQKDGDVCGEPFEEIEVFFDQFEQRSVNVLDLGCGQGRDTLMVARKGHSVTGVDIAEIGVRQMVERAKAEGLDVTGLVADITEFEPSEEYDVVLLDRVLHMLNSDKVRKFVLETACSHTRVQGYVLVADTPANLAVIDDFFHTQDGWSTVFRRGNFRFAQRVDSSAS